MSKFIEQRQVIFQKMAQIDQMEYGSLKAEFRPGADPEPSAGPLLQVSGLAGGQEPLRTGRRPARRAVAPGGGGPPAV